ncbi:hypothetical protein SBA1_160001 [Candidatus Sulfotelmatobacter kueseliae]|uniref:Uncharacterized protein n=1 Tax=Candidatus Sulfotelmatobacter kueseliae TaxID=2042962 RepID=A0A2U3KAD0_9BACT|nr:hypothetical protein SBA1_160001 [Candidatus Sulfotelmatobacter kueseliae]
MGFAAKVFQLIKTRSASSNVIEQVGELSVRGLLREFQQDLAPWTVDVLRIGKVFMPDPVKGVEQFFFEVHAAAPAERGVQARLPCCPQQNPTIRDRCR